MPRGWCNEVAVAQCRDDRATPNWWFGWVVRGPFLEALVLEGKRDFPHIQTTYLKEGVRHFVSQGACSFGSNWNR